MLTGRRNKLLAVLRVCSCLYLGMGLALPVWSAALPNIIVILADDLGYGDISSFGAKDIATPHIDQLAEDGLKLTQFYAAAAVCTPSRAGLMTGRYSARMGMQHVFLYDAHDGMPQWEITIPEQLHQAGLFGGKLCQCACELPSSRRIQELRVPAQSGVLRSGECLPNREKRSVRGVEEFGMGELPGLEERAGVLDAIAHVQECALAAAEGSRLGRINAIAPLDVIEVEKLQR